MARFKEIKSLNPKTEQKEIAKELVYSGFTLQPYRQDMKMQSPHTSKNRIRPQLTWNALKILQKEYFTDVESIISRSTKKKNNLKGGNSNDTPIHGRVVIKQAFS